LNSPLITRLAIGLTTSLAIARCIVRAEAGVVALVGQEVHRG
jgi:hypothetical protein